MSTLSRQGRSAPEEARKPGMRGFWVAAATAAAVLADDLAAARGDRPHLPRRGERPRAHVMGDAEGAQVDAVARLPVALDPGMAFGTRRETRQRAKPKPHDGARMLFFSFSFFLGWLLFLAAFHSFQG